MDELEKTLEQVVKAFLFAETKTSFKDGEIESATKTEEQLKESSTSLPVVSNVVPQMPEDNFIENLYQCLEERGIIREVRALFRQRLVEVIKVSSPQVVHSGCDNNYNSIVMMLFNDFLCCHKLLFTYSVLISEISNNATVLPDFKKMYSRDAEGLLEAIGIRKDSELSKRIMRQYSEKEFSSLLECIIELSSVKNSESDAHNQNHNPSTWQFLNTDNISRDEHLINRFDASLSLRTIDYEFAEKLLRSDNENIPHLEGSDQRLFQMSLQMERDKESQIRLAMAKFREDETGRIRDEISNRLKFEFISKEKELLRMYDDRVKHMKHLLEREKDAWFLEKTRKEKELFDQRSDLIKLMEHVKQKGAKLNKVLTEQARSRADQEKMNQSQSSDTSESHKSPPSVTNNDGNESSSDKIEGNPAPLLLKNVELEATISRLKKENERLQRHRAKSKDLSYCQSNRHSSKMCCHGDTNESNYLNQEERRLPPTQVAVDHGDKLAFLQYTVEQQTKEVEMLKRQFHIDDSNEKDKTFKKTTEFDVGSEKNVPPQKEVKEETDLEEFLAESKRRIAEIEKKADIVGSSLKSVFGRKSGAGQFITSDYNYSLEDIPPAVPKLPSKLKTQGKTKSNQQTATDSVVTFKGMSSAASSIDQALKSVLANQKENIVTHEPKVSEPPHVSRLKTSKAALVSVLSDQSFNVKALNRIQNQEQQPAAITTEISATISEVSKTSENVYSAQVESSMPEFLRTSLLPSIQPGNIASTDAPTKPKPTVTSNPKPKPSEATLAEEDSSLPEFMRRRLSSEPALIQSKVPSPALGEQSDRETPLQRTHVLHNKPEKDKMDLGDALPPKLKSKSMDSEANPSANKTDHPVPTTSRTNDGEDAFEMMAEEDFWAL